jgi:hypothetical protein
MKIYSGLNAWLSYQEPPRAVLLESYRMHRVPSEESLFSGKIQYQPCKEFSASGDRIFGDWITSNCTWDLQVCALLLPYYASLLIKMF